jgi:hypothetical protein
MKFTELPWVLISAELVRCNICKKVAKLSTITLEEFILEHAEHKAPPTHYPVGDMVSVVTKALGFTKRCGGCEQRKFDLNHAIRRLGPIK